MQLPLNTVKEVIEDAAELGAGTICISGGEPFLYHDLLEVVDFIYRLGLKSYIYSSGIIFNGSKPSSVPGTILQALVGKVGKLIINMEAADSELYDIIMGTSFGGFEMMKQTICTAVSKGIVVEAHMVPMKINVTRIPEVIKLCNNLGVTRISFLRLVNQGRAKDNVRSVYITQEEYLHLQEMLLLYRDYDRDGIRLGIPFQSCSEKINCQAGTVKLTIRYDGNVYPCEAFKDNLSPSLIHSTPDNVKYQRLKDIYQDSKYINEVKALLESFQLNDTCETCLNQFLRRGYEY